MLGLRLSLSLSLCLAPGVVHRKENSSHPPETTAKETCNIRFNTCAANVLVYLCLSMGCVRRGCAFIVNKHCGQPIEKWSTVNHICMVQTKARHVCVCEYVRRCPVSRCTIAQRALETRHKTYTNHTVKMRIEQTQFVICFVLVGGRKHPQSPDLILGHRMLDDALRSAQTLCTSFIGI